MILASERAAAFADHLSGLVDTGDTAGSTDGIPFEDILCEQLGGWLKMPDEAPSPIEEYLNPNVLFDALIGAVEDDVLAALENGEEPDGWRRPWRTLTTLAAIAPHPTDQHVADVASRLRAGPGGRILPKLPKGPRISGRVLWARDAYGSRFGIVTPIETNATTRWYLFDIDACGFEVFTVFSRYFADADEAGDAWRAGVGEATAGSATFTPAGNAGLLSQLLPSEMGAMRVRGESVDQFAEYHRSKRIADVIRGSLRQSRDSIDGLDAESAATSFLTWLAERRPDPARPAELDGTVAELADSWTCAGGIAYEACSPHRVASTVLHMRDYYLDDFAAELIALMPDWVAFLVERNGTPAHLVERCLPYATGTFTPTWPTRLT